MYEGDGRFTMIAVVLCVRARAIFQPPPQKISSRGPLSFPLIRQPVIPLRRLRVLRLFLRVRLVSTNSYVESYQACEGDLRKNSHGFDPPGHGVAPSRSYHGLWWTYALNPAHRCDPDTMGGAAMCWIKGIRPPQPEQIHADGTLFLG